ncbi:DUF397 domain-containing protein [Glycomyces buryatensis]|uniref:DUF397 domain-containing protein n=1 Tax=Glycomyces buryatensis TaxID=2570927 RepID=A0A4S8PVT8_9ACTN|nr:DUF397 domain-containing protein [Glycomyces buryatensis]
MTTRSTSHPVEDLAWTTWRKSSRSSDSGNGQCVEVRASAADLASTVFQVRDSKLGGASPTLRLTAGDFTALLKQSNQH